MPIREYECPECWFRTERIEYTVGSEPLCPRCDEEIDKVVLMQRIISLTATPQFKGEGWQRPATYTKPIRGCDL